MKNKTEIVSTIIFVLLFIWVIVIFIYLYSTDALAVEIVDGKTGEEMTRAEVTEDSILTVTWEHSVEEFLWIETFQITNDRQLNLVKAQVGGSGAGTPYQENVNSSSSDNHSDNHSDKYVVHDSDKYSDHDFGNDSGNDKMTFTEKDKTVEEYQWMTSGTAETLKKVQLDGEVIFRGDSDELQHMILRID